MEKQVLALLTAPQRGHNAKLRQGLLSDNGRGAPIGAPLFSVLKSVAATVIKKRTNDCFTFDSCRRAITGQKVG